MYQPSQHEVGKQVGDLDPPGSPRFDALNFVKYDLNLHQQQCRSSAYPLALDMNLWGLIPFKES